MTQIKAASVLILVLALSASAFAEGPVKVFILAGQSNMEGHGIVPAEEKRNGGQGSLEYLATQPESAARYRHTRDPDGNWRLRDDVRIWYLERTGRLTAGYGARSERIGPEFQFGHAIGDHFEQPVLLIKTAWGGKSLAKDFRPPSSGGETGEYYTRMLQHVRDVLEHLDELFPEFQGLDYELVGMGWHQGWNDRINQAFNDEYEQNLAHLIQDVRRELKTPQLPFVVAETGMSGLEEKHPRALSLMRAQAAVAERPEFQGNVAFVGTKRFFRPKDVSPSGQAYHWNTNAETYFLIGDAMAQAMIRLISETPPSE